MIFASKIGIEKSFLYFPLLCIQSDLCISISLAGSAKDHDREAALVW